MNRCENPHPKFRREQCHNVLYRLNDGKVEVHCDRCGKWTRVKEVDKVEAAV